MVKDFNSEDEDNPYAPPDSDLERPRKSKKDIRGKVSPPAIALMITASFGLAFSIFNIVYALVSDPPIVDPNAPEFVRGMQQGAVGLIPAVLHTGFLVVNGIIIVGGLQMKRLQTRPLAIAASVLAMINVGTCCCIAGLPVGIWSLVVLMNPEVVAAFDD